MSDIPREPTTAGPTRLVKLSKAWDRLQVSRSHGYALAADGHFDIVKVAGGSRIREEQLDAFIAKLPIAPISRRVRR